MKKLLLLLLFVSNLTFGQFSESFEGGIPASWTVLAGGDTAETWGIRDLYTTTNTVTAQNGTKSVAIFSDEVAHDDYLVTPQITVVSGVSDKLTFWARSQSSQWPEVISVKASTTSATALAMTTVLAATIAPSGSYFTKYTIDLSSLLGQSIYIGFHSTTADMYSFEIDNEFNQCIKYVCKILISATSDYQNKRSLNDILFLLDDVSDVTISADQCKRMRFNPIFSHFETVRDYCSLFLENSISVKENSKAL